ncbi:hypothetical protein Hamer_G021592 [Homarus americanus]|uniref:Uncharacterized protein n=1 Tax=Homarus americanus TaxID=6706 RepID=A0A8J5N675_HOMAM|nr:hypothetical protein Hamer_G021592 [Homarus americanus]
MGQWSRRLTTVSATTHRCSTTFYHVTPLYPTSHTRDISLDTIPVDCTMRYNPPPSCSGRSYTLATMQQTRRLSWSQPGVLVPARIVIKADVSATTQLPAGVLGRRYFTTTMFITPLHYCLYTLYASLLTIIISLFLVFS